MLNLSKDKPQPLFIDGVEMPQDQLNKIKEVSLKRSNAVNKLIQVIKEKYNIDDNEQEDTKLVYENNNKLLTYNVK